MKLHKEALCTGVLALAGLRSAGARKPPGGAHPLRPSPLAASLYGADQGAASWIRVPHDESGPAERIRDPQDGSRTRGNASGPGGESGPCGTGFVGQSRAPQDRSGPRRQGRRHEILFGGDEFIGTQTHLLPKFSFCSDFGHFILKMVENAKFSSVLRKNMLKYYPFWAQSYQDGDVAMSPQRPHFMSPRPHSEGLVHSDADGVQNWLKCVARNLWKLNSHLVPSCNPRMWRMSFSVFFYSSSDHIIKNRK